LLNARQAWKKLKADHTGNMFETPVLFLIFNRPDTTARVFAQIKKVQPKFLFVAADGPRKDKDGEKEKCRKVREIVMNEIDWDCNVKTLFRDENLGCGKAPANAITWFFENVDEGIILEDDCVPDESFFTFCSVLLDRYRMDERIMHIGGDNFQFGKLRGDGDYYYSMLTHNWGWATWKRAWKLYEFYVENNEKGKSNIDFSYDNKMYIDYFKNIYLQASANRMDIWDYQWQYAVAKNNGIAICPNKNLVKNIGFGEDATHTLLQTEWNNLNTAQILLEYKKPSSIEVNCEADEFVIKNIFGIGKDEVIKKNNTLFKMKFRKRIKENLKKHNSLNATWKFFKQIKATKSLVDIFNKFSSYTMIPKPEYLRNLELVNSFSHLDGVVVECGVWRGGMIAGIASLIGKKKHYYLFDSFEGLPPVDSIDGDEAYKWQSDKNSPSYFDNCKAEMNFADAAMKMALGDSTNFQIIKGWFIDTINSDSIKDSIAILRLDGDWYESTMICLVNFFPKVVTGGLIIIDDYHVWEGCTRAIHDYLSENNRPERICQFNNTTAYIIKVRA